MEQELTSSSVHSWSRSACTSRSSSCGQVASSALYSGLGTSYTWEVVGSSEGAMGHTALNMAHTAAQVWPGKWETDMTQYILGLRQSAAHTGNWAAPWLVSSLHAIWGHSSHPGTGAYLVVGVDLL